MSRSPITKHTILAAALAPCWLASGATADASELRYEPVNPSFGGNPLNSSHLLGTANAQNTHEESRSHSAAGAFSRDPLEMFKANLTSRLLSAMSGQLVDAMYGEDAQEQGTFQVDDMVINFNRMDGQLHVEVTDGNGGHTVIQLPLIEGR